MIPDSELEIQNYRRYYSTRSTKEKLYISVNLQKEKEITLHLETKQYIAIARRLTIRKSEANNTSGRMKN